MTVLMTRQSPETRAIIAAVVGRDMDRAQALLAAVAHRLPPGLEAELESRIAEALGDSALA